jgi:hypothetical protein
MLEHFAKDFSICIESEPLVVFKQTKLGESWFFYVSC